MLKIRAIKIEINTSDGLFGADFKFSNGLNIIRGDNSTGKSSLFQAIIYGLGLEELLGGKNEKTMQSALKDQVEFPKGSLHDITQSVIYLEIENKEIVTVKRTITNETRKSQLVDVYFGTLITNPKEIIESRQMYIHDAGGASDETFGFHLYLAEFLGWHLPEILNTKGDLHKLYLQQIAPAFIIEQKSGWSDFFATMPYFGMSNTQQRVIEFLLKLDVFENEKRKQLINSSKQKLINNWQMLYNNFQNLASRSGGKLIDLESTPLIINDSNNINIVINVENKKVILEEFNELKKKELFTIEEQPTVTVGNRINQNDENLKKLHNYLNQISLNYDFLSSEIGFDIEKLRQYNKQFITVQDDLRKNRGALKVTKLGGELPTEIAKNICPTCEQEIVDSLLPSDIEQIPMRLDENISFLDSQEKMLAVYIEGQQKVITEKSNRIIEFQNFMLSIRKEIRDIKRELIQDERLPSAIEIEKRVILKQQIESLNDVQSKFSYSIEELKILSKKYSEILADESNLPKEFLSMSDKRKLSSLEENFISLLKIFDYNSKPFEAIRISRNDYLPVAQKLVGENLFYNIKFDSSATDFIRCIWAFTTALLQTSITFETNHPKLLMFDEPKQHDMSMINFRSFLLELSKLEEQQVLVFASFENSDVSFEEATKGLNFNLNKIEEKLIKPIKQ